MEKWNEEVVELLVDLNSLKMAERSGSESITNVLFSWVEGYFSQNNFEGSLVLNYTKTSKKYIRITVLQKKLLISVDGFADVIKINTLENNQEVNTVEEFYIGTFISEKNNLLSRKVMFNILDDFTKLAVESYIKEKIYL
ncbi:MULTISPECIES: hypothetical protein [unclassified Lysinibacillus]|uniref:hypothetical protein n=1 Tax=unclassified Lysinibacillus TaxID=2636778 RepID=UPI00382B4A25